MPQVFDPTTGKPVDVPLEEAGAGLAAGRLGVDANAGPVLIRDSDGKIYKAAPNKVGHWLRKTDEEGKPLYSLLSHDDEIRARVHKTEQEKGLGGSLAAAGKTFLNQALFGVPLAAAEAGETRDEQVAREATEEEHQPARALAGALGIGTSFLYGGEFFRGAEALGQAAEHAVVPAVEAARAGLAARIAAKSANYAAQGAVLASPQAFTEALMGDPKKAAETLAWGIGPGAVLGVPAELLGTAARAGAEALAKPETKEALEKFAAQRTAKAVGAQRAQLNRLSPERLAEVADFAHEEGIIRPGMSRQEVGKAIDSALDTHGAKMRDVLSDLDGLVTKGTEKEALETHGLRPGELGDRISQEMMSPEMHMPINSDMKLALEKVVESANRIKTTMVNGREVVLFDDAQRFLSQLRKRWAPSVDKALNEGGLKGPLAVTPLDQMKNAAYFVARDAMNEAADRLAVAADRPALNGALAAAKRDYSKVAELDRWAANLERQQAGNRLVKLTDFLALGHLPFAHIGEAIGGPLGKGLGSGVDFLLKRWFENRGLVTMASVAHKAAKLGPEAFAAALTSEGAQRLQATLGQVRQTVQRMASSGIAATQARTSRHMQELLGSTSGLTADQALTKLRGRLGELASNPGGLNEATAALAAPLRDGSPKLADAYQQQLQGTIQFLHDSLPKPTSAPMPFAPIAWHASKKDELAFHDRAEIATNPYALIHHLERGTLSQDHLLAAKTLYPQLLGAMQSEVLQFSAEHPDVKLPHDERQSMAKFLGAPLDAVGQNAGALQATYVTQPAGSKPGPEKMAKGRPKDLPSMRTTWSYGDAQNP